MNGLSCLDSSRTTCSSCLNTPGTSGPCTWCSTSTTIGSCWSSNICSGSETTVTSIAFCPAVADCATNTATTCSACSAVGCQWCVDPVREFLCFLSRAQSWLLISCPLLQNGVGTCSKTGSCAANEAKWSGCNAAQLSSSLCDGSECNTCAKYSFCYWCPTMKKCGYDGYQSNKVDYIRVHRADSAFQACGDYIQGETSGSPKCTGLPGYKSQWFSTFG